MFSKYMLIVVWIGACALLVSASDRVKKRVLVNGKKEKRYTWWFAFLVFFPIIWIAGNRGYIADTTMYIAMYRSMPSSFAEIPTYLLTVDKDKWFFALSAIIKCIFGPDHTTYLMIFAFFQGISLIILYRKYSTNYAFSIFLFVASSDYFSWMFNGFRQFIAVTIILLAAPLMIKKTKYPILKKYIPLFFVIYIASKFHQSALLMIPLVLIAQGKAWNKLTLLFIGAVVVAMAFVGQFTNILEDVLADTQYGNVVSDYTSWGDNGTNVLRVLVYSVPTIFAFIGRKRIQVEGNSLINFCTNMSILSTGLYLVSMVTSGIFIGRLPIYCSLFGYILLPWQINNMFDKGSAKVVYLSAILFYLLFYYYQMHFAWGVF